MSTTSKNDINTGVLLTSDTLNCNIILRTQGFATLLKENIFRIKAETLKRKTKRIACAISVLNLKEYIVSLQSQNKCLITIDLK